MKRCPKCKIILSDGSLLGLLSYNVHHCLTPKRAIYYYHANGDTYPGIVNKVKIHSHNHLTRRIQITYNGLKGDKTVWVNPTSIILQGEK